jgi:hypothetical protein
MKSQSSAGPPVGLSQRLKELEQAQNDDAMPTFDLNAAVIGGRRRRRRRNAAQALGAATTLAVIAIAVSLTPLSDRVNGQGPVAPATAPAVVQTLPAGVGADRLDTAKIIELEATPTRLTDLRYEHVDCNPEADADAKAESGMAICGMGEVSSSDPGPPSDQGTSRAQIAPGAVILGSFGLGTFLNKPAPKDMNWPQLPEAERHVTPAQLRAFLNSKDSSEAQFRLHFNTTAQIDTIEEIYTP